MAIMDKEKMREYNQQLVMDIVNMFPKSKKVTLQLKNNKVTVKVKGSSAMVILYVTEDISVFVKVFTVNFQGDTSSYCYFEYEDYQDSRIDLRSYRSKTIKLFKYLISEAINMPFCPEERNEMTPGNATKEELEAYDWYGCWEGRFLEKHNYNEKEKLTEWIDRCLDPKIELERRKLGGK